MYMRALAVPLEDKQNEVEETEDEDEENKDAVFDVVPVQCNTGRLFPQPPRHLSPSTR